MRKLQLFLPRQPGYHKIPLWRISTLYMFSKKVRQIDNNRHWFYIQLDGKYKTRLYMSYRSNYFAPYLVLKSGFRYIYFMGIYFMFLPDQGMGPCIMCRSTTQNAWTLYFAVQMIEKWCAELVRSNKANEWVRSNRANEWGLALKATRLNRLPPGRHMYAIALTSLI